MVERCYNRNVKHKYRRDTIVTVTEPSVKFFQKERDIMRSTIRKGLALGLGLAVTSKEQAQKVVDELVERGELSKQESKEFFNELLEKGKETQKQVDEKIQHKLNQLLDEANLATKEEVDALKERVEELEKQLEQTK